MTTSDTIRIMLIKCRRKPVDICQELKCSPQSFSNKLRRSSWTVSDLASIVHLCRGTLLIELPDGSKLPLDTDSDSVSCQVHEVQNKSQPDSPPKEKASLNHQKKAKQKNRNSSIVTDGNTPDANKQNTVSSDVTNNPASGTTKKAIPEKQKKHHEQKKNEPTKYLPEGKPMKPHSRKEMQIDGQQDMFAMLDMH